MRRPTIEHTHDWWRGTAAATEADHYAAFRRYDGLKTAYRYAVCECGEVRIDTHDEASNGIWTLAELACGLREEGVHGRAIRGRLDAVARRMERLAREVRP